MRTRSAFNLINDVRVRSDQLTSNGATSFIDDPTILEWLNQAWADLYDHLIKSGEHYYLRQDDFVTTTKDLYPLPADHYKTMGVSVQNNGYFQPIHRFQFEQRDGYIPQIQAGFNVRHFFYPVAQRMTLSDGGSPAGSNSFIDGVNGWELYVIDWAAKKCAERDENADLAAMLGADIGMTLQRIVSMCTSRNVGEAPRTRIVRGRGATRTAGWGMGMVPTAFGQAGTWPSSMRYDLWGQNLKLIQNIGALGPGF